LNHVIAKQHTHNPNKSSSDLNGRSIGINSQKSEMNVSFGSPNGTKAPSSSVNCSPLSEIFSTRLDESKGLINGTQQLLPSPSLGSN
jgi:hypothetical protein